MPIKINGATSGSTTITAPATGGDESIELSTALASKLPYSYGTATPSTTDEGFIWYDDNNTPEIPRYYDGANWVPVSGLTLVLADSFTSVSSVQINNVFSNLFTDYRLIMQVTGASNGAGLNVRGRAGGSTSTSSSYVRFVWSATEQIPTPVGSYASGEVSGRLAVFDSGRNHVVVDFLDNPISSTPRFLGNSMGGYTTSGRLMTCSGSFYEPADGLDLSVSSGTMSGNLRIYGYREA